MENNGHQIPDNNEPADNNIDLTLRLGLPFYDRLRLEDNNNIRRQQGQGNFPIQFVAPIGIGGPYGLINPFVKRCQACGRTTTTLWRRGPNGPQTLCNACGIRHARNMRRNVEG